MPKVATAVDAADVLRRLAVSHRSDDVDERILDAAGHLLRVEGLAGLEVDRVAARSGVGRSTIYRRFDGRNALIAAALAHESRRFLAVLADVVDPADPLEVQVVDAFTAGLRAARATGLDARLRDEPLLLRMLTVDAGPVVAAARDQLVALRRQRDGGSPDPRDAAAVAELLVRLAISLVLTPESVLDEATLHRALAPLVGRQGPGTG